MLGTGAKIYVRPSRVVELETVVRSNMSSKQAQNHQSIIILPPGSQASQSNSAPDLSVNVTQI